jgi:hypothetical protein
LWVAAIIRRWNAIFNTKLRVWRTLISELIPYAPNRPVVAEGRTNESNRRAARLIKFFHHYTQKPEENR